MALTSLFNVARALDVDVPDLLPGSQTRRPTRGWTVTFDDDPVMDSMRLGERDYRFLSANMDNRTLEPLLVTIYPTVHSEQPYSHEGEEFARVIHGELLFRLEDETEYRLTSGDCIHLSSSRLHAIHNDTANPTQVLWVLSQPLVNGSFSMLLDRHRNDTGESYDGAPEVGHSDD